jgi:hypothetical protein
VRRRRLLSTGTVLGALVVAGCTDGSPPATDDTERPEGTDRDGTGTPDNDGTGTPDNDGTAGQPAAASTDGLDLGEANVTGVEVESRDDDHRFSVTLIHDDEGEDGYANWWQVETLDGQRLGRRDLSHPHGTREFTRSETVAIPDGVDCVVVRGHDRTHVYGGQAALVAVESGTARLVRQGSDSASFDASDCP